jgi:hypothetical protein
MGMCRFQNTKYHQYIIKFQRVLLEQTTVDDFQDVRFVNSKNSSEILLPISVFSSSKLDESDAGIGKILLSGCIKLPKIHQYCSD